jgi:hypothetical protein
MTEYEEIAAAHPEIALITRLLVGKAKLSSGIASVIAICEQDARDQDHNADSTSDKQLKAYAEGRGTACRGIAARLRVMLADPAYNP